MVYEIQQPSDITYRLDDWGRVDSAGNPREMHREQGLAVSDPTLQPEAIPPIRLAEGAMTRDLLVTSPYFSLERWKSDRDGIAATLPDTSGPQVVTVLEGSLTIAGHRLAAGQSAVLWPANGIGTNCQVNRPVFLRALIPEI
jgi:mannose-6-phosphate isomerase